MMLKTLKNLLPEQKIKIKADLITRMNFLIENIEVDADTKRKAIDFVYQMDHYDYVAAMTFKENKFMHIYNEIGPVMMLAMSYYETESETCFPMRIHEYQFILLKAGLLTMEYLLNPMPDIKPLPGNEEFTDKVKIIYSDYIYNPAKKKQPATYDEIRKNIKTWLVKNDYIGSMAFECDDLTFESLGFDVLIKAEPLFLHLKKTYKVYLVTKTSHTIKTLATSVERYINR